MIVIKRPLPLITAAVFFLVGMIAMRAAAETVSAWMLLLILTPLVFHGLLLGKRLRRLEAWTLLIPLLLLAIGSAVVLLNVPGVRWQYLTLLFSAICIWILFETEFAYFLQPSKYIPFALERVAEVMLFLGSTGTLIGLFGIDLLDMAKKWLVVLLACVLAVAISASAVHLARIPAGKRGAVFAVGAVFLVQLFWTLQFFPISFVVTGSVAGIGLAMVFLLMKYAGLESLDRSTLIRTLLTGGSAVLVLLATTRWT